MQRRHGRSGGVEDGGSDADGLASTAAAASLPAAPAPPPDRLGFRNVGEGAGGTVNLVPSAPAPHPLLFGTVLRGPTNH